MSLRSYHYEQKLKKIKVIIIIVDNNSQTIFSYLLSSPSLQTWIPVAVYPQTQRLFRLSFIRIFERPALLGKSGINLITCLIEASFNWAVRPTPESQPLECIDGTDVSALFIILLSFFFFENIFFFDRGKEKIFGHKYIDIWYTNEHHVNRRKKRNFKIFGRGMYEIET